MAKNLHLCFTTIKSPDHPLPQNHSRPFSNPSPSLLIKNFNSIYEDIVASAASDRRSTSDSDFEPDSAAVAPDFATAVASRRFFFSSPGRSNSIVDSSSSSSSAASTSSPSTPLKNPDRDTVSGGGGGVAVPTYSPDPFADFRRSMQEMVEAREVHDLRESWDYLHELLMCYLSLNPKSTHKFIVGAFADLLVSLMTEKGRRETTFAGGECDISRRCV